MRRIGVRQLVCALIACVGLGVVLAMGTVLGLLRSITSSDTSAVAIDPGPRRFTTLSPQPSAFYFGSRVPPPRRLPLKINSASTAAAAPTKCEHTRQGAALVVDDRGYLCVRSAHDARTGCCVTARAHLHACAHCNDTLHCCRLYEECVSCCMRFAVSQVSALEAFAHCQRTCRTASWSLDSHQRYLDAELPYCYERHTHATPHTLEQLETQLEQEHREHSAQQQHEDAAAAAPSRAPTPDDGDDDSRLLKWFEPPR